MKLEGEDLLGGIVKDGTPGTSATDPEKIAEMLPTAEAEARRAEFLGDMFSTTTRAGAGGTKSGLFGIRPRGGEAVKDFHENFTGTGRYKQPARPFEKSLLLQDDYHAKEKLPFMRVWIPRNVCVACMRTDRPTKPGPVEHGGAGGTANVYVYFNDRPDLGINAGECVGNVFCQECVIKFQAKLTKCVLEQSKDLLIKEWMYKTFINRERYIQQ
ncbi:MAG: hypothetical protein ACRD3W_22580, partial [Terriglobales bacterium]